MWVDGSRESLFILATHNYGHTYPDYSIYNSDRTILPSFGALSNNRNFLLLVEVFENVKRNICQFDSTEVSVLFYSFLFSSFFHYLLISIL